MLQEIANLYVYLTKQEKILIPSKLSIMNTEYLSQRYTDMTYLINLLKRDIFACYYELNRFIRDERINLENTPEELKIDQLSYIRILEKFNGLLKSLKVIKGAEEYLPNYVFGTREIYSNFFRPDIIPNFTFTRLLSSLPKDG